MTRQTGQDCPKCGSPLGAKATYCGCGWKTEAKANPLKSAGITNCAWISNGEQCHFPGTISNNTQGLGPWHCRFHSIPGISQAYGDAVVRESRTYRPLMMEERDKIHIARMKDMDYKPKVKGCEELRCLRPGTLQENGRYLCSTHAKIPSEIEYAKPYRGNVAEQISMREPGQDESEVDEFLDVASQA